MATQIKIDFISDGFKQILCSSGTQAAVESAATAIQTKANANLKEDSVGFSKHSWLGNYGGGRYVASVSTTDGASMRAEAYNKALSRAVQ